jgi:hypothetical protein
MRMARNEMRVNAPVRVVLIGTDFTICIGFIVVLGIFRYGTGAEFAFASLVLFPVLLIAWIGEKRNGLILAFLGVAILSTVGAVMGY